MAPTDGWLLPLRRGWWAAVWSIAALIWCRRLDIAGVDDIPTGPVVFAANHGSHADTVVLQLALARAGHHRVLAAGAADYFFRNRFIACVSTFLGVYAFPRSGEEGVVLSRRILAAGWSVIVYPQGTRNGGPFRPGVSRIATRYPVVPVTIRGTDRVLPKGSMLPRRAAVDVRFGAPIRRGPAEEGLAFAAKLEAAVTAPGSTIAA